MSVWSERIRPVLARSPKLRAARVRVLHARSRLLHNHSLWQLPPPAAVRMIYNVLLQREPDPTGFRDKVADVTENGFSYNDLVNHMRGSDEFQVTVRMDARTFGPSVHAGRCQFIRTLPRAARIIDLGGTHLYSDHGALVSLGYPYPFDELIIIDLPPDERHPLYQKAEGERDVPSPLGTVKYRYHSMTDLSRYDDAGFDLVYSGQSIEHVTEEEGDLVLKQVHRLLRPGGHLALDTPNGRATRLQQDEFVDPDHKVEYTHEQMMEKLARAGFTVIDAKGLNYLGRALERGVWDPDEAAANTGLHAEIRDCYILCYVARKD
jgi:predicted SAM-dependent methyltransferase